MPEDIEYLKNYRNGRLYINPGRDGAFVTMARDGEEIVGEIAVSERFRLVFTTFFVTDRSDFSSYRIVKLKLHKTHGWREDGDIRLSRLQLSQIIEFNTLLATIDVKESQKERIDFGSLNINTLAAILRSHQGRDVMRSLADSEELRGDVFALGVKRAAIAEFEVMMDRNTSEPQWQAFFEANPWIFGHGLSYLFLDKVAGKLEVTTKGSDFSSAGKRVDGLMRTRAAVSQYVLVEIKKHTTALVKDEYRSGCWRAGDEVVGSVTQVQKAVHEFVRGRFKDQMKGIDGVDLNDFIYAVEPRSYVVVGMWSQLEGHSDKIASFELFRRNLKAPEIITFDELLFRARQVVANANEAMNQSLDE